MRPIDTWTTRDLPALIALVRIFDDPTVATVSLEQGAEAADLSLEDFARAAAKLAHAKPPFIVGFEPDERGYPVLIHEVTERALVAAGQWPLAEDAADRLLFALAQAADQESDPERRSKMQAAASVAGSMLRSVIVSWVSGELPHPH